MTIIIDSQGKETTEASKDGIDTVHEPEGGCGGEIVFEDLEGADEAIIVCVKCGTHMHLRKLETPLPARSIDIKWGLYSSAPRPHGWATDFSARGAPLRKFNTVKEAKEFALAGGDDYKTFTPRMLVGPEAEALMLREKTILGLDKE